jgi:type I restriction enzyme S subunit
MVETKSITELTQELCPDGVEYRALGDVCEMQRGTSITKKNAVTGDIPVISGGREPAFYCDKANRTVPVVTVAGSGAGAGYVL